MKRSRACNVCGEAATKICSQCKCRQYCGQKCQRQDWKSHKQYCSKSLPGRSDEINALKKLWLGPREDEKSQNDWKGFLQEAGGPNGETEGVDGVDLEKLQKLVMDAMKENLPPELLDRDCVGYPMHVVKQLGVMPSLPLVADEFVVSYSTFGQMEATTGQLIYYIACMSNTTEFTRAVGSCAGVPTTTECESVLFAAMIKPMPGTGDLMRPSHVLLAHRWGTETYESLRPFLTEHGIDVRLETEAEAKRAAAMNNVDPNGFNV